MRVLIPVAIKYEVPIGPAGSHVFREGFLGVYSIPYYHYGLPGQWAQPIK